MSPRRPGTADERDLYPRKTPPKGHPASELAIPHHVEEPGTGVVEGDELRRVRERRPTPERVSRLENRQDTTEATVADIRVLCGRMDEKLDSLIKSREESRKFWRAVALKAIGGFLGSSVIVAVLRACGVL